MKYYIYDKAFDVRKELIGEVVILGRNTLEEIICLSKDKDITQIDTSYVSERHCIIDLSRYPCIIKNNSKNKTKVNNNPVDLAYIQDSDIISLGPWNIEFRKED